LHDEIDVRGVMSLVARNGKILTYEGSHGLYEINAGDLRMAAPKGIIIAPNLSVLGLSSFSAYGAIIGEVQPGPFFTGAGLNIIPVPNAVAPECAPGMPTATNLVSSGIFSPGPLFIVTFGGIRSSGIGSIVGGTITLRTIAGDVHLDNLLAILGSVNANIGGNASIHNLSANRTVNTSISGDGVFNSISANDAKLDIKGSATVNNQLNINGNATVHIGGAADIASMTLGSTADFTIGGDAQIGSFTVNGDATGVIIGGSLLGDTMQIGGLGEIQVGGDFVYSSIHAGSLKLIGVGGAWDFGSLTAGSVDVGHAGSIRVGSADVSGEFKVSNAGNVVAKGGNSQIKAGSVDINAGNIGAQNDPITIISDEMKNLSAGNDLYVVLKSRSGSDVLFFGNLSAGHFLDVEVPGTVTLADAERDDDPDRANPGNFAPDIKAPTVRINAYRIGDHNSAVEIDAGSLILANSLPGGQNTTVNGFVYANLIGHLNDPRVSYDGQGGIQINGFVIFNQSLLAGRTRDLGPVTIATASVSESPDLISRLGVFGSPYFVTRNAEIRNPRTGVIGYILSAQANVRPPPESPKLKNLQIEKDADKSFLLEIGDKNGSVLLIRPTDTRTVPSITQDKDGGIVIITAMR
jgi:hypothetical protein